MIEQEHIITKALIVRERGGGGKREGGIGREGKEERQNKQTPISRWACIFVVLEYRPGLLVAQL